MAHCLWKKSPLHSSMCWQMQSIKQCFLCTLCWCSEHGHTEPTYPRDAALWGCRAGAALMQPLPVSSNFLNFHCISIDISIANSLCGKHSWRHLSQLEGQAQARGCSQSFPCLKVSIIQGSHLSCGDLCLVLKTWSKARKGSPAARQDAQRNSFLLQELV